MNRLQSELTEQLPQTVLQHPTSILTNNNQNDNTFAANAALNDHQAQIRRRAPTRHSIKSLTGRKSLSKQNSAKEVTFYISISTQSINSALKLVYIRQLK